MYIYEFVIWSIKSQLLYDAEDSFLTITYFSGVEVNVWLGSDADVMTIESQIYIELL